MKACSFRQKDLGLFLVLFITRSLACFFKGWLCEVEHSSENYCIVKMCASIIVPRHGVVCVDLAEACLLVPIGKLLTVLKFCKTEAGWVYEAAQLRSPENLPLSSDMAV